MIRKISVKQINFFASFEKVGTVNHVLYLRSEINLSPFFSNFLSGLPKIMTRFQHLSQLISCEFCENCAFRMDENEIDLYARTV